MRPEQSEQGGAVGQAVQLRDGVERGGIGGQAVCLPVVDHLQAMLDRAEQPVGLAQRFRVLRAHAPGLCERRQRRFPYPVYRAGGGRADP